MAQSPFLPRIFGGDRDRRPYIVHGPYGPVEIDYTIRDDVLPRHNVTGWRHPAPQHWYDLRKIVFEKANCRCQLCGKKRQLQLHHNSYDRWGCEVEADVIALCRKCHHWHEIGKRLGRAA